MARTVDHARRAALLDAAVDVVVTRGVSGLTWRPMAAALGVTPTTLVHHFGTRERMLQAILGRVRERIVAATTGTLGPDDDAASAARAIWRWSADPAHAGMFRLFFAVYGLALEHPDRYPDFLGRVVEDWVVALRPVVAGADDPEATTTLVVATLRGLLLDLLTTGDRDRVQRTFDTFVVDRLGG